MTITLFVEPKSLPIFLEVTKILKGLEIENNYIVQQKDDQVLFIDNNKVIKYFVDVDLELIKLLLPYFYYIFSYKK